MLPRKWGVVLYSEYRPNLCFNCKIRGSSYTPENTVFLLISEWKGEEESNRKINDERESLISCLLHAPHWGSSLQCEHVAWLGIEPRALGL